MVGLKGVSTESEQWQSKLDIGVLESEEIVDKCVWFSPSRGRPSLRLHNVAVELDSAVIVAAVLAPPLRGFTCPGEVGPFASMVGRATE